MCIIHVFFVDKPQSDAESFEKSTNLPPAVATLIAVVAFVVLLIIVLGMISFVYITMIGSDLRHRGSKTGDRKLQYSARELRLFDSRLSIKSINDFRFEFSY